MTPDTSISPSTDKEIMRGSGASVCAFISSFTQRRASRLCQPAHVRVYLGNSRKAFNMDVLSTMHNPRLLEPKSTRRSPFCELHIGAVCKLRTKVFHMYYVCLVRTIITALKVGSDGRKTLPPRSPSTQ